MLDGRDDLGFSDVLPGGRAALASTRENISGDFGDIVVVDIDTGEVSPLISSGYGARFVPPGYLLFGRAGTVMAATFDVATRTVTGEPAIAAADVAMDSFFHQVHAASSAHGLLAYVPGGDLALGRLAWVSRVDRDSQVEWLPDEPRLYGSLDLSPDGRKIAVHVGDVVDYIWISEIDGRRYRMPATGALGWPVWEPDSRRMVVRVPGDGDEPGGYLIHDPASQRGGPVIPLASPTGAARGWSPVDDVLAIMELFDGTWRTSFARIDEADREFAFEGTFPVFSPDGQYVAFSSNQGTGASEVYIRGVSEDRVSPPFSLDGGTEPQWNAGTGELFYRRGRQWYGAKATTDPELRWESVHLVFDTAFIDTPGISYDVSPDGRRLLVVKRAEANAVDRIELLTNWPAALAKRR